MIPQIKLPMNAKMPMVGFGTRLITNESCKKTVAIAIEAGYRHIDTAEQYQNEHGVGSAIRQCIESGKTVRDELFITTKLWPGNIQWGQQPKNTKTTILALNESLKRLQMQYVDLYLIHAPMSKKERLAQWRGMLELQQQGKARAIGVSNFSWRHIEEISAAGLPLPEVNQIELHPWAQKPAFIDYLRDQGIVPTAYSSLLPLPTWRSAKGHHNTKSDEMIADGNCKNSPLKRIAKKYGVAESQLLLRWGIQKGYPVIPKSIHPERIQQNLDIFSFNIDQCDIVTISAMNRGAGFARSNDDPSRRLKINTTV